MPQVATQQGSQYNQTSFSGGMNLQLDDSQLGSNMYRIGFNLTNRNGTLDPVLASALDTAAPFGLKQELVTFGQYELLFCAGAAYYKHYTATGWKQILGFSMSPTAERYWTCAIPVSTTNYNRIAATGTLATTAADPAGPVELSAIAGAVTSDTDGLLVQDNVSQPQFIFLDPSTRLPVVRTTQSFSQWSITFTDATGTVVATDGDKREYVPIGNCMTWEDGILYVVSQDLSKIYRSVSGRPLDFVIAVSNDMPTGPDFKQIGIGDATSTAYSVGSGNITCIRPLSSGGVFVSAGGNNYAVTKNTTPGAPTLFGEYTFLRKYLFSAVCLSDRTIIDTVGDTRFISLTGVRSFNAVAQTQNEGRNLPFTATIQSLFGTDTNPIIQDIAACILFNDYELYAVETILGPVLLKFDTTNNCWTSVDMQVPAGVGIKILAKIDTFINVLYAVTTDDQIYRLYVGPTEAVAEFRTVGVCANVLEGGTNIRVPNPKNEIMLSNARVIINNVTAPCVCSFTPYVNNRLSMVGTLNKTISYSAPTTPDTSANKLPDVDTMLYNLLFDTSDCEQGWKVFGKFSWTGGSFTQFSMEMTDLTPLNPLNSQISTQ